MLLLYLVVCFLYCCDLLLGCWVAVVCYLVYGLGLLRLLGCVCYGYLGLGCGLFVVCYMFGVVLVWSLAVVGCLCWFAGG